MSEPVFDKYERKGAYHWKEMERSLVRRNAVLSARYQFILRNLPPSPKRVLDIGCGDGYLSCKMAEIGHFVHGCDTSETGLQWARTMADRMALNGRTEFLHMGPYETGLDAESFELVVLADVLEHVMDPGRLLQEARRVLTADGLLLLSTPAAVEGHRWDACHVQEYSRRDLEEVLSSVFTSVQVEELQIHFFFRTYVFRILGFSPFRVLINAMDLAGVNPFFISRRFLPISVAGQLYAACRR